MIITNFPNYHIFKNGAVLSEGNKFNKPKFLKYSLGTDGYYAVNLYNENGYKRCRIHRLVAEHFIPKVEGKELIDHIDRNKTNNHISNLRWCNKSENQLNKGVSKNNVLGIKHIRKTKYDTYTFTIYRQDKWHTKSFKALDECIKYRDEYLKCSNTCAGR